jgi:Acyl-CoA reductase (LuxC)
MQLPNYFLADLANPATLTPGLITEACQTLKRNREKFLAPLSTGNVIDTIAELAHEWLDEKFDLRRHLLAEGPAATGFSRETLAAGLDGLFRSISRASLEDLILQDLGHVRRLDEMVSDAHEAQQGRASQARGPQLITHITGGVLPNPTLISMILGLLTRSAQFLKCPSRSAFLPRMFAHSLYHHDRKLGACLEIADWPGGHADLEAALFAETDCVTVTGSDATLGRVRCRVPATIRFVGYGHRVSFAFIAQEAFVKANLSQLARQAAEDIVAWNQLGCLSPHVIYLEANGPVPPDAFGDELASELGRREQEHPRGGLTTEESAAIATRRSCYQIRAATDGSTRCWSSENSTAWTIVMESDPAFCLSCMNRFVYLKPVSNLEQLLHAASTVQAQTSTVGIAAPRRRFHELAGHFARWGATRVCPLGRMQSPSLSWRHDGRASLAELVTWTTCELPS